MAGAFGHGDQGFVGRDLEILEGVVGEGVLQDLVGHGHVAGGGHVGHELGRHVLQERAVLAENVQHLVEAAHLAFRLGDVPAQQIRHFRIMLESLHLALHELQRFLFEGMGVLKAGDEDVLHGFVGRQVHRACGRAGGHDVGFLYEGCLVHQHWPSGLVPAGWSQPAHTLDQAWQKGFRWHLSAIRVWCARFRRIDPSGIRLGLQTALDDIPARPFRDDPDLRASKAQVIRTKQT